MGTIFEQLYDSIKLSLGHIPRTSIGLLSRATEIEDQFRSLDERTREAHESSLIRAEAREQQTLADLLYDELSNHGALSKAAVNCIGRLLRMENALNDNGGILYLDKGTDAKEYTDQGTDAKAYRDEGTDAKTEKDQETDPEADEIPRSQAGARNGFLDSSTLSELCTACGAPVMPPNSPKEIPHPELKPRTKRPALASTELKSIVVSSSGADKMKSISVASATQAVIKPLKPLRPEAVVPAPAQKWRAVSTKENRPIEANEPLNSRQQAQVNPITKSQKNPEQAASAHIEAQQIREREAETSLAITTGTRSQTDESRASTVPPNSQATLNTQHASSHQAPMSQGKPRLEQFPHKSSSVRSHPGSERHLTAGETYNNCGTTGTTNETTDMKERLQKQMEARVSRLKILELSIPKDVHLNINRDAEEPRRHPEDQVLRPLHPNITAYDNQSTTGNMRSRSPASYPSVYAPLRNSGSPGSPRRHPLPQKVVISPPAPTLHQGSPSTILSTPRVSHLPADALASYGIFRGRPGFVKLSKRVGDGYEWVEMEEKEMMSFFSRGMCPFCSGKHPVARCPNRYRGQASDSERDDNNARKRPAEESLSPGEERYRRGRLLS